MDRICIRKKHFIIIISYLCAALAVLAGFICVGRQRQAEYQRRINAGYMRAFAELSADVSELDASLQKLLYSTSPSMLSALCSNIYGKANAAQTSLAELPLSDVTLENASAFIARTGDYANYISRRVSSGSGLDSEEYSNLQKLSDAASILAQNITEMQAELESGSMRISDIGLADSGSSSGYQLVGERFQLVENEFPELPELIYDGPFSQHLQSASPAVLRGRAYISAEKALERAAAFSGLNPSELSVYYASDGDIPLHCFSTADGSCSVSVTKSGGEIYSMDKYRPVPSAKLSREQAVTAASGFLAAQGYDGLHDSYWTEYDGLLLINFAATQDGVICYPDLVKTAVALDSGEIIAFEAAGYISSHAERSIPQPAVSVRDAQDKLSPALKVLSSALCIIPTAGKNEVFCHEFKCENESGDHYLVYINAETGLEEKILCLIESENGTLTM